MNQKGTRHKKILPRLQNNEILSHVAKRSKVEDISKMDRPNREYC